MAGDRFAGLIPNDNMYVIATAADLPQVIDRWRIYHLLYDPGAGAGLYYSPDAINLVRLASGGATIPAGTVDNSILRWNSGGAVWTEFTSFILPLADGAANQLMQTDGLGVVTWVDPPSSGIIVEDEGVPLVTSADTLDFIGDGVTAAGAGTTKDITVLDQQNVSMFLSGLFNTIINLTQTIGPNVQVDIGPAFGLNSLQVIYLNVPAVPQITVNAAQPLTIDLSVAANDVFALRNAANIDIVRASDTQWNQDVPVVFGPYSQFAGAQYGFSYTATESFTAGFVGGGLNFSGTIDFSNSTFIYESFRGAPTITTNVNPGFAAYTVLQALPRFIAGVGAGHNPLNPLILNCGPRVESGRVGSRTSATAGAVNWSPTIATTLAGAIMNVTNMTGLIHAPKYSTVAGSTANFGTIRAIWCQQPAVALFAPSAGTEIMTSYTGLYMENMTFGGAGRDIAAVRSLLNAATNVYHILATGTAPSIFGGDVAAPTFNDVPLTDAGVATNFLDETGNYSVPNFSLSPLTTVGDLWGYNGVDARVPVGTDGAVLTANSGDALGVSWVTPPPSFTGLGLWRYRTETVTPPASGQIRFDNADVSLATEFYISETNNDGTDVSAFMDILLTSGVIAYIQNQSDSDSYVLIECGAVVDSGTFRTVQISQILEGSAGEPIQNQLVTFVLASAPGAGGALPAGTVTDSSLRWSGAAWVEETDLRITSGGLGRAANGTAGAPAWSFVNDTDTGIYGTGNNFLRFAAGGVNSFVLTAAQFSANLAGGPIMLFEAASVTNPTFVNAGDLTTGMSVLPAAIHLIVSGAANVVIEPTQFTMLNYVFDSDQAVGAGQDNFVLTYDNGTGLISLEAAAGGIAAGTVTNTINVWSGAAWTEQLGFRAVAAGLSTFEIEGSGARVKLITTGAGVDEKRTRIRMDNFAGFVIDAETDGGFNSNFLMSANRTGAVWQNLDIQTSIQGTQSLYLDGIAAANANIAGYGQIWVDSADGDPYYTDDAGVTTALLGGGGGTTVDPGVLQGDMLYWDTGSVAWVDTSSLTWDNANSELLVGANDRVVIDGAADGGSGGQVRVTRGATAAFASAAFYIPTTTGDKYLFGASSTDDSDEFGIAWNLAAGDGSERVVFHWLTFPGGEPLAFQNNGSVHVAAETVTFNSGAMVMVEQTTRPFAPAAGTGVYWVRDDVPSVPMFTDDADVDHILIGTGGTLPAGTVTDATLRWSGSAWVEDTAIRQDLNANLILDSSAPHLDLRESGATADEGNWLMRADADELVIATATDASPTANVDDVLRATRTAAVLNTVKFGNYIFDVDQAVGVGQDNFVLTYDDASGLILLEAAPAGGVPAGADEQVQWNDAGAFGADGSLAYDGSRLLIGDAGVGGIVLDLRDGNTTGSGASASMQFTDQLGTVQATIGTTIIVNTLGIVSGAGGILIDANQILQLSGSEVRLIEPMTMLERTTALSSVATYGQFWVRDDAPNVPMFTDDAGTDHNLLDAGPAGAGIVSDMQSAGSLTLSSTSYTSYLQLSLLANTDYMVHFVMDFVGPAAADVKIRGTMSNTTVFNGIVTDSNSDASQPMWATTAQTTTNEVVITTTGSGNGQGLGTYVTISAIIRVGATPLSFVLSAAKNVATGGDCFARIYGSAQAIPI